MQRTADKDERSQARQLFFDWLSRTGNYRTAAKAVGVSERTGRRWLADRRPRVGEVRSAASAPALSEVTSFVGRDGDLAALAELFATGARLVSVCGPPGMGKTRLVREFARRERAWFCDLTFADGVDDICRAVGNTLRAAPQASASASVLGRELATRGSLLLVLDNFERLVPFGAETITGWLMDAPDIRILVGSRNRLRLAAEQVLELGPLGLPTPPTDREGLQQSDAGRLFLARVAAVRPDRTLTDPEVELAGQLLRWLEGIPLAIEMIVPQLARLSVTQVLGRVTRRIDLADDRHDAPRRHATLRAAIESSWQLLTAIEKTVLSRATVFRGGFDLEAARVVLAPPATAELDVAKIIASLHERSLVRLERLELTEPRVSLYEYIREYAEEQLDEGERQSTLKRYVDHYIQVGEALGVRVRAGEGAKVVAQLAVEFDNLLAVYYHVSKNPEGTLRPLRIALALHPLLNDRGPGDLDLALLDGGLAASERLQNAEVWTVRGYLARAEAFIAIGALERARSDVGEARRLGSDYGLELQAEIDYVDALRAFGGGKLVECERIVRMGLERLSENDVPTAEGALRWMLARALIALGRLEEAEEAHLDALARFRCTSNRSTEAAILRSLAHLHLRLQLGDPVTELNRAQELAETVGSSRLSAEIALSLGVAEHDRGAFSESLPHYEEALHRFRALGQGRGQGLTLMMLGLLHLQQGAVLDGVGCLRESLEQFERCGNRRFEGTCLILLGGAEASLGVVERAERLLQSGEKLLELSGDRLIASLGDLQRGQLELAKARRDEVGGDVSRARERRAWVKQCIANVEGPPLASQLAPCERPPMARAEDVRLVLRLLKQRMAADEVTRARTTAALRIDRKGRWFEAPDGAKVLLRGDSPLSRILAELARQRIEAPGEPLPRDHLIRAGWREERILPHAAIGRIHTTIARLRALGLRGSILSTSAGYLLDPSVPVELGRSPRQ